MLDIKFIRENPQVVKESCEKRGVKVDIDQLLELEKKKRDTLRALEDMLAQKNKASQIIARAKDEKETQKMILEMQELDKNSDRLEKTSKELNKEFIHIMEQIPNLPFNDVPTGKDEGNNVIVKEWGEKQTFNFQPKNYLEIAQKLDLIDIKRAAKVSGTRFTFLKNEATLLEMALVNFAFDTLTKEGFTPLIPPVLIKPESLKGMGYIDTKEDLAERYFLEKDNLFLVGTAEQSIGPMHQNEIFKEQELPKRYVAFSPCFREEAGSYGKETWGIFRVHQFDKVEMFSFVKPEDSKKEHQFLLQIAETLMQLLEIPYRVVKVCTGDLARPSATTFDLESWMPSLSKYRETQSISTCTDFQSRRLNIRYRNSKTQKLEFVHTLNGTAFAMGRTLIAIVENYQKRDGSIEIPKVLQKYLNFKEIKRK